MRTAALALLLALPWLAAPAQIPGARHRDARQLLEAGDPEGAIARLDAVLQEAPDDTEALALRGWAHETAGDQEAAWSDFEAAVASRQGKGTAARMTDLEEAARQGRIRTNGSLAQAREAQAAALVALQNAMENGWAGGDEEAARQAAVAMLRLAPNHEEALATLQSYRDVYLPDGMWTRLYDPSHQTYDTVGGIWRPLPGGEQFEAFPNGALDDAADIATGVTAPEDGFEIEFTVELLEAKLEDPAAGFVFGPASAPAWIAATFRGSSVELRYDASASGRGSGRAAQEVKVSPREPRHTLRASVIGGDLRVFLDGKEALESPGAGAALKEQPVSLQVQRGRFLVLDPRMRTGRKPAEEAKRSETSKVKRAIKAGEEDCLEQAEALVAEFPCDPAVHLLRAEAALARERRTVAVRAYRRVLEEEASKRDIRSAEQELKDLAVEISIDDPLQEYARALDAALESAPAPLAGCLAAYLRDRRDRAVPPEEGKAYAWTQVDDSGNEGRPWQPVPLAVSGSLRAAWGNWEEGKEGVRGERKGESLTRLTTPYRVGQAFDVSVEYQVPAAEGDAATSAAIGVSEPLASWSARHTADRQEFRLTVWEDSRTPVVAGTTLKLHGSEPAWHTLRVAVDGSQARLWVDGEIVLLTYLPPTHRSLEGGFLTLEVRDQPTLFRSFQVRDRW